jgi:hypothetical protein
MRSFCSKATLLLVGFVVCCASAPARASVLHSFREGWAGQVADSDYHVPSLALVSNAAGLASTPESALIDPSHVLLMHFDVSSLSGSNVQSATLVLHLEKGTSLETMTARVLNEGNGGWLAAAEVSGLWQDDAAMSAWQGFEGPAEDLAKAGSMRAADALWSEGVLRLELPPAVVQGWAQDPDGNCGLYIRAANSPSNAYIWTSAAGAPSLRPALVVEAHAPEPATAAAMLAGIGLALRWRRRPRLTAGRQPGPAR